MEQKRKALGSTPSGRLAALVPESQAFLQAAFERGESTARLTVQLLHLLDDMAPRNWPPPCARPWTVTPRAFPRWPLFWPVTIANGGNAPRCPSTSRAALIWKTCPSPILPWRLMMNSPKTPKTLTPNDDLVAQLERLGLLSTAQSLDDVLARAATQRWSPRQLLEEIARSETADLARRSLERRLAQARLGRFKPLADFEWNWPKKIDRPLIERALTLDFLVEPRNCVIIGSNGLGKTMIAKNIAHAAVLAGHSVLFRTAADLLADLEGDSPGLRRRKFRFYARPALLVIDECISLTTPTPPICSSKSSTTVTSARPSC